MADKPHILILMPDQLRADTLGCAGHPLIQTPNIDRIAQKGVLFANAHTVSPVCMPARASFVSGIYPHNHHLWQNAGSLPAKDETFFHHLQQNGYFVGYVGKSHFYSHKKGLHLKEYEPYMHARGIDYIHETTGPWATLHTDSYMTDYWQSKAFLRAFREDYTWRANQPRQVVRPSPLPEEDFIDSYVGQKAVEFISTYNQKKPFCLFVGFPGPHEPWDAPGRYATMYDPAQVPAPIPSAELEEMSWLPDQVREELLAQLAYTRKLTPGMDEEDIRRIRANYYGKISLIDHWVGEILQALEKRGWLDETMIVFWSDHGEMAGDHGFLFKQVFYDGSVRVPLIISHPAVEGNRVSSALTEIIDVYPTLLEAIGAEPSQRCHGRSLWPLLQGKTEEHRPFVLSEIHAFGAYTYMIRTARYKYAWSSRSGGYLLFDQEQDPLEQLNLIGHPDVQDTQQEMKNLLLQALASTQTHYTHQGERA
ncbi:MAG: sulfatase-like hydrolase/transferase [Anaerolineae bacterium]|nr:sulfatase-like hydrolase/transferase [Anaerolineae bacterium]